MSHNASSRTCGAATWSQLTCRPETAARDVEFGRGQPPGQATDQSCASNNWNGRRRRVASDYERQATIRPASNTCSYDRHPLIVKASHARSTRFASPGIDLTAPRVVTLGQIPAVVARSATALRARPQTDVRSAWSSAVQNPANQTLTVRLPRQRLQNLRPEPGRAQRRVVHRDGSAAMSDNAAVTRALNAARARTCFDPSVRSPDRLGSRAPLQAHFWIGKDSASHRQGEAPEMKAPSTGREKRRGGTRADVRHLPKCMKCNHEIGPGEAYEAQEDAHGQLKVWHAVRLYFDECAIAIPKTLQKMGFCR